MSTISLKLVNAGGVPNAWPGIPTATDPTVMGEPIAVWIGVSADGTTNQGYPIETPLATILVDYPRIYQGTQVVVDGSTTNLYANPIKDLLVFLAACCVWLPVPPVECESCTIMFIDGHTANDYRLHILDTDLNQIIVTVAGPDDTQVFPALEVGVQYYLCLETINNLGRTDIFGDVEGGPLSYTSFPTGCGEGSTVGINCVFTIGPGQG